jgi:hypothetical protein
LYDRLGLVTACSGDCAVTESGIVFLILASLLREVARMSQRHVGNTVPTPASSEAEAEAAGAFGGLDVDLVRSKAPKLKFTQS